MNNICRICARRMYIASEVHKGAPYSNSKDARPKKMWHAFSACNYMQCLDTAYSTQEGVI